MAKQNRGGLGRGLSSLMPDAGDTGRLPRTVLRERVVYTEEDIENAPVVSRETSTSNDSSSPTSPIQDEEPVSAFVPQVADALEEAIGDKGGSNEIEAAPGGLAELPIDSIKPNPDQPRTNFDDDELEELSKSIKKDGLLQPILVRVMDDGSYQIIAGERRWQASKRAGLSRVPVRMKDVDDDTALELALVENVQRSDLNPIEEAYGYRRLMDRKKMTQADIAQAMSKGRSTIANALRLLELPEAAQQMLFEEKITAGHARAILSVNTREGRETMTRKLAEKDMSVRDAEAMARLLSNKPRSSKRESVPSSYKAVAKELKEILKTNVKVKSSKGKNKIEIEFKDEADLKRLFEQLISE